jgi:hypothetical protein
VVIDQPGETLISNAARGAAARRQSFRIATRAQPRALGQARARGWKVKISRLDRRYLLRQVVYEGLREDKPAAEVRREVPRAK